MPDARIDGLTSLEEVASPVVKTPMEYPNTPANSIDEVCKVETTAEKEEIYKEKTSETITEEPDPLACLHNRPKCVGTNIA